jgi:hypothetical protein
MITSREKAVIFAGGVVLVDVIILGVKRAFAFRAFPVQEPDEPAPAEAVPGEDVPPTVAALSPDTHITPNFRYGEFAQKACLAKGFPVTPYPAGWIASRLKPLADVLEVIRAEFGGRAIEVNSAYRSPAYNASAACMNTTPGATNSQHTYGRAADIVVKGVDAHTVRDRVLKLYQQGKIKIGGLGRYVNFTHVDIRPGDRLAIWG